MSLASRVKSSLDKLRLGGEPVKDPAGTNEHDEDNEHISDGDDEDEDPVINDVESIKEGIIKTLRYKVGAPYNILLVGETGTGKSSLLEFIANVLIGKDIDCYDSQLLDHDNERGGSGCQSQTNSARVYELESKNGIKVRILDTPGLADTRGIDQDKLHKKSIAEQIKNNIATVNAVLILVNGTVPRITVGTNYALSALSALFPKSLANNIAFLFSNSSNYLAVNFSDDAIPPILSDAPRFLLDNPIALMRKFSEIKDGPNQKMPRKLLRQMVMRAEQKALEMLVDLFDWLDGLEPQPTKEIVVLYDKSQAIEAKITNTLAQMHQAAAKMAEIKDLMKDFPKKSADVDAFSNFEKIINAPVWEQVPSETLNYVCTTPFCYSTCAVEHSIGNILLLLPMQFMSCSECTHPHLFHFHLRSEWVQVPQARVSVDSDMKRQWEAAKNEKERTDALAETSQRTLDGLSRIIDEAMDELAQLADDYAELSLSGSFSAPLEKAIWLLEQQCKGMEEKGVGPEQLAKVRSRLEEMTMRLDVLRQAQEKAVVMKKSKEELLKGIRKVTVPVQERVRKVSGVQESDLKIKEVPGGVWKVKGEIQEGQVKEAWERARERVRPDIYLDPK